LIAQPFDQGVTMHHAITEQGMTS